MAFIKAKAMQEAEKLANQGKTAQAIKQYSLILEKDPTEVSLLNTIGDLYYRDKNTAEALKCFYRLAEAYVKDGFTVKAIAIYKKISKIDPNSVDPFVKLAELYVLQGLGREAREQYTQAVEIYKKKNQPDKALDVLRKIAALDPENKTSRARLAEFAEQTGRKEEAARAYLELAEVAFRGGDIAGGEPALKKALELGAKSDQASLLQARVALAKQEYDRVEKIIDSVPELKASAPGRQLLLEAYLADQKLEMAEKLVVDVFNANPADFSPVASFSALCVKRGNVEAAVKLLSEVADLLIERKTTAPALEILRQIWAKNPDHLAAIELIHRILRETADEFALPEVLRALGRLYEQSGDLEKAEAAYRDLVKQVPGSEEYQNLLREVLQKQGKEAPVSPTVALAGAAIEVPPEAPPAPPAEEIAQAEMVKEGLENSDLFSRYGLVDKAVAELEKVLAVYPEQPDIHRRILEICHRSQPERAGRAAEALEKIHKKQGDTAGAAKYRELATQLASGAPAPEVPQPPAVEEAPAPSTPAPAAMEFDLSEVFGVSAPEAPPQEIPREIPLDVSAPAAAPPPEVPPQELELPTEFGAPSPTPEAPVAEKQAPAFNYEEARVEIDFYLEQGFLEEARNAVRALEEKFPGDPFVAELRQRVEAQAGVPPAAPVEAAAPEPVEATAGEWELPAAYAGPASAEEIPQVAPPPAPAPVQPPAVEPPPPEPAGVAAGPPSGEAPPVGGDFLGSLVGDLEAGLEGFGEAAGPPASERVAEAPQASASTPGDETASLFRGLLEELGEGAAAPEAEEDPEKHYNLGVAFREMGLLDEAIGEFQKVVKGARKDAFPPNFLQACSLLAVCFMDKGMPAIAAKWYKRALELPDLDEESTLALQYDLGVAYEQAGDTRSALERLSEVYSQNIDYRDVAEKIRTLQKKAP
jgi:tetratricopeptide (TPR) repeat protein